MRQEAVLVSSTDAPIGPSLSEKRDEAQVTAHSIVMDWSSTLRVPLRFRLASGRIRPG